MSIDHWSFDMIIYLEECRCKNHSLSKSFKWKSEEIFWHKKKGVFGGNCEKWAFFGQLFDFFKGENI